MLASFVVKLRDIRIYVDAVFFYFKFKPTLNIKDVWKKETPLIDINGD